MSFCHQPWWAKHFHHCIAGILVLNLANASAERCPPMPICKVAIGHGTRPRTLFLQVGNASQEPFIIINSRGAEDLNGLQSPLLQLAKLRGQFSASFFAGAKVGCLAVTFTLFGRSKLRPWSAGGSKMMLSPVMMARAATTIPGLSERTWPRTISVPV